MQIVALPDNENQTNAIRTISTLHGMNLSDRVVAPTQSRSVRDTVRVRAGQHIDSRHSCSG